MDILDSDFVVYTCLICWLITAVGATVAIFSPKIRDTLNERASLCIIALGAAGASYRIYAQGWTTDGGQVLAIGAAYYVITIFCKKWRDHPETLPADKCPAPGTEVQMR